MKQQLFKIPELSQFETRGGLLRIPVEQDVPFTPRVRALVDTAAFRRLAGIRQLGMASLVYPGATHTRFEHALGVYHNALRYLEQLAKDSRFRKMVDGHRGGVLLAAALLHDVGHWPFCHPIEEMKLPGLDSHEHFAEEFICKDEEVANVLRDSWRVGPGEILDVLVNGTDSPALRLMRSILSGPIDIDKMDYLDRDSLHCGVPYGRNFDKNRLMQSLLLNAEGDGLAISAKGRTAAELMVFARYVMFSEVYWHHAVRAATSMFARAFYALHRELDLRCFFKQSDAEMIAQLRQRLQQTEYEPLVEGIFGPRRRLYKRGAEYSQFQQPEIYEQLARRPYPFLVKCAERLAERLGSALKVRVRPTDVLIDAPPARHEVEFRVDIYYPKEDIYRPLEEVSPVVQALSRNRFDDFVKRVRVFVHPRLAKLVGPFLQFQECLQEAISETPE